jgi:putative ABC transport system permease protein
MLDVEDLSGFENISAIAPQVNGNKQVIYGANNISISLYGVTPTYLSVRNSKVQYGDFITDDDVKN